MRSPIILPRYSIQDIGNRVAREGLIADVSRRYDAYVFNLREFKDAGAFRIPANYACLMGNAPPRALTAWTHDDPLPVGREEQREHSQN